MYGNKIRLIRAIQGRTQEDVAKEAGILQNEYSRIENDKIVKPSDTTLQSIAQALHVTLADLKNPSPILLFHPSSTSDYNQIESSKAKMMEDIIRLLKTKDEQINQLIHLIAKG